LLFLGSGSVIHAVGTNDMRQMGGLWRKMPITAGTFVVATAAISGVPWLSGFYSKEAILTQALSFGLAKGHVYILPFAIVMLTACLTAFYMFRIVFMTFVGRPKDQHRSDHAHESPPTMWVPLAVLCLFTFFSAGFFGIGESPEWFHRRVGNVMHARLIHERYPDVKMPVLEQALAKAGHGEGEGGHGEGGHREGGPREGGPRRGGPRRGPG